MEDIGKEFGGRDHSTVVYSISNVEEKMSKDSFYRGNIEDIIKNVKTSN
jgi:chromosomal replication initiator protein